MLPAHRRKESWMSIDLTLSLLGGGRKKGAESGRVVSQLECLLIIHSKVSAMFELHVGAHAVTQHLGVKAGEQRVQISLSYRVSLKQT